MRFASLRFATLLSLCAAGVAPLFLPTSARAQTVYIGRGAGLDVNVLNLVGASVSDTGLLPSTGGGQTASLLTVSASLQAVARADTLSASTVGTNNVVDSTATVHNLILYPNYLVNPQNVLGQKLDLLTASVVTASAHADFSSQSGSSVVTNLIFGGNLVTVTGAVNQTVTLPGVASLIINHQFTRADGSLTTNALDLDVLSLVDGGKVTVSQARAGVQIGGGATAPEPASLALFATGLPAACLIARRLRPGQARKARYPS